MPPLRQRLTLAHGWLLVAALLWSALLVDANRKPSQQYSVKAWSAFIHGYRSTLRLAIANVVRCRFDPSCSHYSEEAVRRFGIARGLLLTAQRLARCTGAQPFGTSDLVPIKTKGDTGVP
jgi:putative component of membrane protein insertase Oxa1/YidC/SpoIIIJ protein YidD